VAARRAAFSAWRRNRPFTGGLLAVLAGVEMFFSIIPLLMVLLGILATVMPVHRIFYGVLVLAISVYSLVGVNLGGFFIGMLLGALGGILIVAWMPRAARHETAEPSRAVRDRAPVEPSRS
jgi:hypothetical protein